MDPRSFNNLVIPGWVIFELKLNYSELRLYCLILGYSQHGEGEFYGSLQYLADWCGISNRQNVRRVLNNLIAKGLITKHSDKQITTSGKLRTVTHYRAIMPKLDL